MNISYEDFKKKILPAMHIELRIRDNCRNKPEIGYLCRKCNLCGRFIDNETGLPESTKIEIYNLFINGETQE